MQSLKQEILQEMNVKPTIDPAAEFLERTNFLSDYLVDKNLGGFVLGISGGQDSLLAGYIAQKAVAQVRETGQEAEFHAMLLPYGEQNDRQDALDAINFISPDVVHNFQIKPMVDTFEASYNDTISDGLSDFDKGNVKARTRMMAQYAVASQFGLLVIGTDHAAEAVTGFFTKHGDGAADILPLSGLSKRQGKQMLEHIGAPDRFISKQPTADLLDAVPGQADETELGLQYDQIDNYLEGKDVDRESAATIEYRFITTRHKRDVPVAFGA